MSKINYEDWIEEDPFHPCLHCGCEDFSLDMVTELYTCNNCGETLVAPNDSRKKKRPRKRPRLEEDWE